MHSRTHTPTQYHGTSRPCNALNYSTIHHSALQHQTQRIITHIHRATTRHTSSCRHHDTPRVSHRVQQRNAARCIAPRHATSYRTTPLPCESHRHAVPTLYITTGRDATHHTRRAPPLHCTTQHNTTQHNPPQHNTRRRGNAPCAISRATQHAPPRQLALQHATSRRATPRHNTPQRNTPHHITNTPGCAATHPDPPPS